MEEQSRGYLLLKENESIFSRLKQKVKDINSTDQKLTDNIKNIKTPSEMRSEDTSEKENCSLLDQCTPHLSRVPIVDQSFSKMPLEEISFCNSHISTDMTRLESIVFIPFNKLYRSPILQLKGKDKLILARKYKGSSLVENKGKITDGKIYKFDRIITEEEQLFNDLTRTEHQSNIIGIVGAKSTLKKKIHMCLLIKEYQKLLKRLERTKVCCKIQIHYSEISERQLTINEEEVLEVNLTNKNTEIHRLNKIFEHLLEVITNKNKNYGKKCQTRTRISRIIVASESQKSLFELISSNNQNLNFIRELRVRKLIWCVNPLVKNYDSSQVTLENVAKYQRMERE